MALSLGDKEMMLGLATFPPSPHPQDQGAGSFPAEEVLMANSPGKEREPTLPGMQHLPSVTASALYPFPTGLSNAPLQQMLLDPL